MPKVLRRLLFSVCTEAEPFTVVCVFLFILRVSVFFADVTITTAIIACLASSSVKV